MSSAFSMNEEIDQKPIIKECPNCNGEGKVLSRKRRSKKQRRQCQNSKKFGQPQPPPSPPLLDQCKECDGCGIVITCPTDHQSDRPETLLSYPDPDADDHSISKPTEKEFHVGIVGGGIGGLALALACQHRDIPFTIYERDLNLFERKQGYGLTMQQGGKALRHLGFGLIDKIHIEKGGIHYRHGRYDLRQWIISKRHIVHKSNGEVMGEWGVRVRNEQAVSPVSKTYVYTKKKDNKRINSHIARQELRRMLYEMLLHGQRRGEQNIKWGYQFISYKENHDIGGNTDSGNVEMTFCKRNVKGELSMKHYDHGDVKNPGKIVKAQASILVGADGIRSVVRQQKIGDDSSPLQYLGCFVMLGICSTPKSSSLTNDGETVFQTADGTTRIYVMPFSEKGKETAGAAKFMKHMSKEQTNRSALLGGGETMWQLSFPIDEEDAKSLSLKGPTVLKNEALERCGSWHDPIPELLRQTSENLISGYPVYDRKVLSKILCRHGDVKNLDSLLFDAGVSKRSNAENININETHLETEKCNISKITLLGDAAHPMSPFKGQGANQALLDAVHLARMLSKFLRFRSSVMNCKDKEISQKNCNSSSKVTLEDIMLEYENNMLERSSSKVIASSEAAKFLHTEVAIMEGNVTRGAAASHQQSQ